MLFHVLLLCVCVCVCYLNITVRGDVPIICDFLLCSEYGNHVTEFLSGECLDNVRPVQLLLDRVEEA